jgi:hypothetical protein
MWVVTVSDVAPDGTSKPLTSGLLEGNQRAVDPAMTWNAPDGRPLLPYHPYTKAAQVPVSTGTVTRFDVEVFPTFDTLEPGHSLRITVATSDFPHVLPTVAQLPNLLGGVYELQHSSAYPSNVEIPLSTPGAFTPISNGPLGCPSAAGSLAGTRLGAVRLGMTRARARSEFTVSPNRGHRFMDVFCLSPSGIRVGYASPRLRALLPKTAWRRVKGRVVLALTTNSHYSLHGVRPGGRLSAKLAHRLHAGHGYRIGRNTWYLIGNGASRGVLRVQHATILEIGIANKRLTRSRQVAARFLRSFR